MNGTDKGQSLTLFLSLFLLLLAFFILLNSLSKPNEGKSDQVLESVKQAFPADIQARISEGLLGEDGPPGLGSESRAELGELFKKVIPGSDPKADPNGNPVRVTILSKTVVNPETGALTVAGRQLTDGLADIFRKYAPKMNITVEIMTGVNPDMATEDQNYGAKQASRQLSTFADAMIAADAPAYRVSIGLDGSDDKRIGIYFYMVEKEPSTADRSGNGDNQEGASRS